MRNKALISILTLSSALVMASAPEPSVKVVRTAIHNNGQPCAAIEGGLYIDGVEAMKTDECGKTTQPRCKDESLKWMISNNCRETFLVYITHFREVPALQDCKISSGLVYPVCEGTPKKRLTGYTSDTLSCKIQSTEKGAKYCYDIGVRDPNGSAMVFDQGKARPMLKANASKFDVVYDPEIIIRRP